MHDDLDPYRQWLGRTAAERPLNYYQLLGLQEFEDDRGRIENAEMIEMAKVLRHEAGPHAALARQVCDELERAVATLSDAGKKAAYDAQLRSQRFTAPALDPPAGAPLAAGEVAANYYRLLGLADFEESLSRIENAEMMEMAKVLRLESGPNAADARRQREALEQAVATLSDPGRKAAYDAQLRSQRLPASDAASPPSIPQYSAPQTGAPPPAHAPSPSPVYDAASDLKLDEDDDELLSPAARVVEPPLPSFRPQESPMSASPLVAPAASQPADAPGYNFAADLKLNDSEEDDLSVPARRSAAPATVEPPAIAAAAGSPAQPAPGQADEADDDEDSAKPAAKKKAKSAATRQSKPAKPKAPPPPVIRKPLLPQIPVRQVATAMGGIGVLVFLGWVGLAWWNSDAGTGQVTGSVTLEGQPVSAAEMAFISTSNPDDAFIGISRGDGHYQVSYRTLKGLPIGRYKVSITSHTLASGAPPPAPVEGAEEGSGAEGGGGELVATLYEFEQEVTRGSNAIDFELSRGKKVELKPGG